MDLEKYGIPGIMILLLLGAFKIGWDFIKDLMKQHKIEREEAENQHRLERENWNRINQHQLEESNKAINRNTDILSGLKTLLENRK